MEGLVLLTFASLPHCTKKVGWGGGVGWVGFVLARLTCCELPFLWPELMCAKLYTGPACISRKSGTLSNWEPNGDSSHLLQFPHGPWTRGICVKSRPAARRSLFWGPGTVVCQDLGLLVVSQLFPGFMASLCVPVGKLCL